MEEIKEHCSVAMKRVRVDSIINFSEYEPWLSKGNYTAHHTNGTGFVDFNDAEAYCKDLPKISVFMHDSGMVSTHNMPCPVCKTNHAVFVTSKGFFDVCHNCRKVGWFVGKREVGTKKFWEFWK